MTLDSFSKWMPTFGIIGMLALQTQFVSISAFNDMSDRILLMEKVLVRMEIHSSIDLRHEKILTEHGSRIRTLELDTL